MENHGDTLIDFNDVSGGPLENQFVNQGVTFKSVTNTAGTPLPTAHNMVFSFFTERAGTIVGTPFAGSGSDDGRIGYEIRFTNPVPRAGLLRIWNTQTLTEFYNADAELLGSHVNTVGAEFVGWNTLSTDPADWVSWIRVDTTAPSNSRQVGYSDDLIFGTTLVPVPEPAHFALFTGGILVVLITALRIRKASQTRTTHKESI